MHNADDQKFTQINKDTICVACACSVCSGMSLLTGIMYNYINESKGTSVSKGFFPKCLAIPFRQENVNQKSETHPVKSYFTKQLLFIPM